MEEYKTREVKKGYWYYDNSIKKGVVIVAINYNYKSEMWDDSYLSDQALVLNEKGESFLIYWYDGEFKVRETDTSGGISLDEAIQKAETIVGQKIEWIE